MLLIIQMTNPRIIGRTRASERLRRPEARARVVPLPPGTTRSGLTSSEPGQAVADCSSRRARVVPRRRRDQVNVVRHQAVASDPQAKPLDMLFQQLLIYLPIIIRKEHVLTVVASLDNVVRRTGNDYTG